MARKKNSRNKRNAPKSPKSTAKTAAQKPPATSAPTTTAKSTPKQTVKSSAKSGKAAAPVQDVPKSSMGDGFDEFDDLFFSSETGSFSRDEFDYDPFDDPASVSGRMQAPEAPKQTVAVMDVPSEIKAAAAALKADDEPETRQQKAVKGADVAKKKKADEAARKKAGAKAKAEQEAREAAEAAEAEEKAKAEAEAKAKAEEEARAAEAEAEAKAKAEEEARAAEAEAKAKAEEEARAAAEAARPVPLSERRAAGAAAAAAMGDEEFVISGGDTADEASMPAAEESAAPTVDAEPRKAAAPDAGPAMAAPLAVSLPEGELPGGDDWSLTLQELAAEAEGLKAKKDGPLRAALLFEIGRILAHRVGDWAGAEARYEAALQADRDYVPALRELVRLYAAREDWARAVDLLARQAKADETAEGRTAALLASAHIQLSQLERLNEAAADLKQALEALPANYIALRFLREIHYRTQAWSDLVSVLRGALDLAGNSEKLRIHYELGRLHDEVLKAPTEATEAFRACLALDGRFIPAMLAAERLLSESGDTAALLDLWRQAGAAWGGADASYWFARAARAGDAASLSPDGVDSDFRAAIAASPAPEVLSEEYRHWLQARGRWDDLVAALEDALEEETDDGVRAALNAEMGRIALQHGGDAGTARSRYEAALAQDAACLPALEGVRQVLAAEGDWSGLLAQLQTLAEGESDTRRRLALNLRMAEIAEVRVGDADAARLHLEAAVLLAPNHLPALDRLVDVLAAAGDATARAERLEQAAGVVEDGGARAAYFLRAASAWDGAGQRDKAIAALGRAEAGPGTLLAREWLADALRADGNWQRAADVLRQAAAEVDEVALKVSLLHRAAGILRLRCDDAEGAEAACRSILDLAPDFLPASLDLRDLTAARGDWDGFGVLQTAEAEAAEGAQAVWAHLAAGEAFERAGRSSDALARYQTALGAAPGSAVANAAMRRIHRSTGDWSALAASYRQQIEGTDEGASRDALRVQLVAALAEVGDAGAVAQEVTSLAASESGDRMPFAALGVVCEALQLWEPAIEVYGALGDRKGVEAAHRAGVLFQRGLLLEEVREDAAGAADLYERAWALVEGHAMALEGLERIHATTGDAAALAEVYAREATAATEQPVRTFYALLAGEQFENLQEATRAAESYEQAFADPVGRHRAYDALRRLSLASKTTERLPELTEQLVGDRTDAVAVARWMELGESLAAAGAEDPAATAFGRVLSIDGKYVPPAYHLERLHTDREDWNSVLGALQQLQDGVRNKSVQAQIEARIQRLLEDKGVTSDSAFDFYSKLLDKDPKNVVALRGVGGIHLSRGEFKEAGKALASLAEHASEPALKAEASTQLGRLALQADEDTEAAVGHFEAAIEHQPTHRPALEELRRIHTESENWTSLVGVVAREASLASEDERLPFFAEIARIWQDRIGNAKVAVSSWNKVLQSDADNAEALSALQDLHAEVNDWGAWLDVAERAAAGLTGKELRDRRAELGRVAWEKAGQVERAVGLLRAAVDIDEPSVDALRSLREIARERLDWEQFIGASEQLGEVVTDEAERVALFREAGQVRSDQLLDREGAARLFRKALDLDANCRPAQSFFVSYYFDTEDWERALPVFETYESALADLDLEDDDDDRMEATGYYYKYGVVLGKQDRGDEALARYARALELTPAHLPSLEAASPQYFEAGDYAKARETARAILRLRGGTGDATALTELYLRLGESELHLGDHKNGLKRFKKALDLSPNHVGALQGIASIHRAEGDWNSLLSTYNSIIKYARDPDQVIRAYTTKGDVLEQKLEFTDKAVLHYEKVLMYDKQNVAAVCRLGEIALRRGDAGKAADYAARASGAARDDAERLQAVALDKLVGAAAGDIDGAALVEAIRGDVGESEALTAFAERLGGGSVAVGDAALAYRDSFCAL